VRGMRGTRFHLLLREMGKVAAIGIIAQLNVVVLRVLASFLEEGSMTHYWYANRLVDLTQGTIAVAVGSALLPSVARDAAERNWDGFRENFTQAVRLAGLVLIPAACLLFALARPVVSILFRHGAFDVASAEHASATLRLLVPFMLALAGINIVKKAFFALDDRNSLLAVGLLGVVFTAVLGYPLSLRMGVRGLGLSLSLSTSVQLVVYVLILRHRMAAPLGFRHLATPLMKMLAASVPAALVAAAIVGFGEWDRGPASLANWVLLAAAGLSAGLVYVGLAYALGIAELRRWLRR
jgi:putative peptidoglycan lipid II flippase